MPASKCNKWNRTHPDSGEQIVDAFLQLGVRHLSVLELLHAHPLLCLAEIGALIDLHGNSVRRYLFDLRLHRLIHLVPKLSPLSRRKDGEMAGESDVPSDMGGRYVVSHRGLRLLAATVGCRVGTFLSTAYASRARKRDDERDGAGYQRNVAMLLRYPDHTAGVYTFFAALATQARSLSSVDRPSRLMWWESGAACAHHYEYHGDWHTLWPDGEGECRWGQRSWRFWLEWDRATMGTRDLHEKFAAYANYLRSKSWQAHGEFYAPPCLLIVTTEMGQLYRLKRAVHEELADLRGFAVYMTTTQRLAPDGPLGRVWHCHRKPLALDEPETDEQMTHSFY